MQVREKYPLSAYALTLLQFISCQEIPTEHLRYAVHFLTVGNTVVDKTDEVSALRGLREGR